MSTEAAKSRASFKLENDPDATAAATPAMSTKVEVNEIDAIREKGKTTVEDVEASTKPANAINESDLLTGKRLWLVWSAFLLSVLLVALDNTIVSTALPKLASHFNALDQLTWIVSAYLLTQAGFILIFGQILTIVPTKWIYLFVIALFEIGSLICGVAPSMNVLIFGRAVAGVGASGIFTSILTVVSYATRLEQRPLLFGTFGAVFTFASVVGPLLGGVFTDKVSWRWCFYINLPLGALSIAAVAFLLPVRAATPNKLYDGLTTAQKFRKLDFVGGFLSLAMITLFLIPLQWGGNTREWNDPVVIGLLAGFGALLIIFLLWEWRMGEYAITPFKMFKNRTQSGASVELFFIFFAFLLLVIYLPFLYQAKGRTAVQSGIDIIPLQLASILGIAVSSTVIRATGKYKPWLIGGPWFAAISGGLFYTVDVHTSNAKLIGYQIVFGFGTGSAFQNTLIAIQAEFNDQPELIPQASAVASFAQLVGGTLGIAVAGTIFSNQLVRNLSGPIGDALGPQLVRAVRQSVTVVFSLPAEQRQPVVDAYVDAVATMLVTIVPVMTIAGISAFAIRDWNLKERGGAAGGAAA
ncbi:probable DHA14-like major facilitator; ABC transporter [Serendipita indica DSM 11827]|uniref:Probable DHA14-like major facilitator ABC transporter n=1 Tax=Serendipita indica (strain DSM 11827) TaxID=1109443 RepID=G4TLA6_SERID|nr:probable DHA14-like major facilitator; ABC transporter [Serendipita indica DSM 11827]